MAKISTYPDGGALQDTDQLVVARAGANKSILGSRFKGYTLLATADKWNPADATTYYFGSVPASAPLTSAALQSVTIPRAGTITRVDLTSIILTLLGTAELSTLNLRLNGTTDTLLSAGVQATNLLYHFTGLSIAVVAGDLFEMKLLTPTWVTNPQGWALTAQVYVA